MLDKNGVELQVRDQISLEDGSITTITAFGDSLFFHTGGAHPIDTKVTLERRPPSLAPKRSEREERALRIAESVLSSFKEAGSIYDDYQQADGFTDEDYEDMLLVLREMQG